MTALTTQSTTPATIPASTQIAADQVGTANAPASGDRIQYVKLDVGAAGASSPVTAASPLPVSNGQTQPLTDTQLRATAVPVSIAATVSVSNGQTQPLTDTQLRATAVPVSGTVSNTNIDVALSTRLKPADTLAGVTTVAAVTAITNPVAVTQPTLTKGTQGATGVSTQDLKDAGRNQTNWFMAAPIITTAAEVMQSMTGYKGGAAVVATTTPSVVTTGKTYRINKIVLTYFNVATVGSALVRLRANTAGVAVVTSPLVMSWQVGLSGDGASTAGHASTYDFAFPDGLEFAAGTGIAFGVIGEGAVPTTATAVGYVLIQCFGYEY